MNLNYKEIIKYNEEKNIFICKKKTHSEHPFKDYQKIFPDQLDVRNKNDEKESNYVVKLYNSEGFNYSHVYYKNNDVFMIKETVDLLRINYFTYSLKLVIKIIYKIWK